MLIINNWYIHLSKELKGASRKVQAALEYRQRAMARRCLCPPLSSTPRSPTFRSSDYEQKVGHN